MNEVVLMLRRSRLVTLAVALLLAGCSKPRTPPPVTIAAVGDTNGYHISTEEDPLEEVRDFLGKQDVFILNFEGALLSAKPEPGSCSKSRSQSTFYSFPRIADFLHPAKRVVATLANNHVADCRARGISETVRELTGRKILTAGAGDDSEQACAPVRLEVNGTKVAIVAYLAITPDIFSAGPDWASAASWEECGRGKQVADLAAAGYVVVVSLHAHLGEEWTDETSPEHLALARNILAAGADVVIGHGPHVPQGIFYDHGRVAMLSLGNFLFYPNYDRPEKARRSVMAQITISAERIDVGLIPLRLDALGWPRIATSQEATQILQDIALLSASFGTRVDVRDGIGYVTVQRPAKLTGGF